MRFNFISCFLLLTGSIAINAQIAAVPYKGSVTIGAMTEQEPTVVTAPTINNKSGVE